MKKAKAIHTVDPPALVRRCLACQKSKCNNCLRNIPVGEHTVRKRRAKA